MKILYHRAILFDISILKIEYKQVLKVCTGYLQGFITLNFDYLFDIGHLTRLALSGFSFQPSIDRTLLDNENTSHLESLFTHAKMMQTLHQFSSTASKLEQPNI